MPLTALLFDKDGTLFDFAQTWEKWTQSLLRRLSDGDEAQARRAGEAIGFDLETASFHPGSIVIASPVGEIADALLPHVNGLERAELIAQMNGSAESASVVECVPLRPFLSGLRGRGMHLGVATNDAEAPARAHLQSSGITELFDFIAGFDSGHGAKPGPGQMLAFARAINTAPDRIAMVGDSSHDLVAGRAAGMATIAVLTGLASAQELQPLADVVLPDIGHIPEWIDAQS